MGGKAGRRTAEKYRRFRRKQTVKKLNYALNNLTFAKKFVLLFFCGVVVPMLLQNVIYYWQTEKNIQAEMLEKIDEAMEEKAEKIEASLSALLSLARTYYNNETLYRYLDHVYDRDLDYLIQYQEAFQTLFSESNLNPYDAESILIYTDNDTLLNGSYVHRVEELDLETLGETLDYVNLLPVTDESHFYFRVSHENSLIPRTRDSRRISLLCVLDHYRQYSDYQKILRIDIETDSIVEVLEEFNLFENMILTDANGMVLAAANSYSNTGSMSVFDADAEGRSEKYSLLSRQIGGFPITLYGIYDRELISQEFRQSRLLSIEISALCLFLAVVCAYAVVGNIDRRLNRLVRQSEEIARGNFIRADETNIGRDEFGMLESSMNRMSAQLSELIEREYKAQLIQAEQEKETNQAKLLALQSQVNPHFMFNALESIRLKAIVKGETETARMIQYMARMFRNLIQWDNNIITLKEEIAFLDEFLHIQSYRFGDEFVYEIDVSGEAAVCRIPKMILQPLVENACVHGVEARTDDRWIRVEAKTEQNQLVLRVEDNGGGMTEEKLAELRELLKGERSGGKSVGLWNVYRRLTLYYGEQFQFELESVLHSGTKCCIRIPMTKQQEGEEPCIRS